MLRGQATFKTVLRDSAAVQEACSKEGISAAPVLTEKVAAKLAEICCKCLFSEPQKEELEAVYNYWHRFVGQQLTCKSFLANIVRVCANRRYLRLSPNVISGMDGSTTFASEVLLQGALPESYKAFAQDSQERPVQVRALMYTGPFAGLEVDLLVRCPWRLVQALGLPKKQKPALENICQCFVSANIEKTGVRRGAELSIIKGDMLDVKTTEAMRKHNKRIAFLRSQRSCPEHHPVSFCVICNKTRDVCVFSPRCSE